MMANISDADKSTKIQKLKNSAIWVNLQFAILEDFYFLKFIFYIKSKNIKFKFQFEYICNINIYNILKY